MKIKVNQICRSFYIKSIKARTEIIYDEIFFILKNFVNTNTKKQNTKKHKIQKNSYTKWLNLHIVQKLHTKKKALLIKIYIKNIFYIIN